MVVFVVSFEPNEALFETERFGVKRSCTVLDFLVVDLKQSRQVGLKGRANDRVVHFSILLRCAIPFRNSGKLAQTETKVGDRVVFFEKISSGQNREIGTAYALQKVMQVVHTQFSVHIVAVTVHGALRKRQTFSDFFV